MLPAIVGHADIVIVAKAVIATGCTAISLVKAAIEKYKTRDLAIVSVFHTKEGIVQLRDEFPHAAIYVLGECDRLADDGLLFPGVGILDERMRPKEL